MRMRPDPRNPGGQAKPGGLENPPAFGRRGRAGDPPAAAITKLRSGVPDR